MSKILLVVLCAFLLSFGTARCQSATHAIKVGNIYQAWFSSEYITVHSSMTAGTQYFIQIDAIDAANSNWVLVEFPQAANGAYSSSLAGKRWLNLNYVTELKIYTPPPGQ